MTPQLLVKIKELVEAGATVVGSPPSKSPSLAGYPACDEKVQRLAADLWGPGKPPAELTERPMGNGRLFWSAAFQKKSEPARPAGEQLDSAQWIWYPEGNPAEAAPPGKRYFRRTVPVDDGRAIQSARLVMTADNSFICWINGRQAGSGGDWKRVFVMDVTSFLKPGSNAVAVEAENGANTPNPAGLIGILTIKYRDGHASTVITDKTWEAAETVKEGWLSGAGAKTGWTTAKELGLLGVEPWGDISPDYTDPEVYPQPERVAAVLEKMSVPLDFSYRTESGAASLRFIHRTTAGAEVYFVANKLPQREQAVCTFRVAGKRPEFWRPETGRIERPAMFDSDEGVVRVPISFDPYGSVFVVFADEAGPAAGRITSVARSGKEIVSVAGKPSTDRMASGRAPLPVESPGIDLVVRAGRSLEAEVWQPASYSLKSADGKVFELEAASLPRPLTISGPWEVRFAPGGGAPDRVTLAMLSSWSESPDIGVKYYSGAATYTKSLSVSRDLIGKERGLWLDLGKVQVMAEVKLNGKSLGILWKPPYRVDITDAVKAGENALEVTVVNLWINRMIGDELLREDSDRNPDGTLKAWPKWLLEGKNSPAGRYTFTSWRLWHKNEALQESGLLGPVRIVPTLRRVIS